jgi:hypothetical protein
VLVEAVVAYSRPYPIICLETERHAAGRAIAQAVIRRLPTEAARVRVRSCGICNGQSGTGGRFSPST